MKHRQSNRNTQTSSLSSKEFSIQASGKMFHMVISGLYSDKPKSITREIYSNAFDAHVMVGKEHVPFDVNYPTSLDPTFTVRDYGPGIPHEGMEDFYTVLGHSTKEDTNVAVGKWGVGRMSPMSYTDTFNVVSRHKGMKAFYSVQLGEAGDPSLHTLAMPTPTDEPDGLEVSFPIDRWDVEAFAGAARRMAVGLKVKPNVLNDENPFEEPEVILEGDGFYFFRHRDFDNYRYGGAYAKMGCVLYPIKSQYVPSALSNRCIVVDFPIGDLDVTASREDLSYDDTTVSNIKNRLEVVYDSIGSLIEEKVKGAKTEFEACLLYQQACSATGIAPSLTWQGKILQTFYQADTSEITHSKVSVIGKRVKVYWEKVEGKFTVDTRNIKRIYIQNVDSKTREPRAAERIYNREVQSSRETRAVWIRYEKGNCAQEQEIEYLKKEMKGYVEFIYTCDLPDPGVRGARSKVSLKAQDTYHWYNYDMEDTEFQSGGVWMPISNNQPDEDHEYYDTMFKAMKPLCKVGTLIVVPKTYWKRFEGAENWVKLKDVVEEYLDVDLEKKQKFASSLLWNRIECHYLSELKMSNPWLSKIREGYHASRGTYDNISCGAMHTLLSATGKLGDTVDVKGYLARLYDQYPLLRHYRGDSSDAFCEYINLMDAKQKTQLAA